jgi:hypothetical protein
LATGFFLLAMVNTLFQRGCPCCTERLRPERA